MRYGRINDLKGTDIRYIYRKASRRYEEKNELTYKLVLSTWREVPGPAPALLFKTHGRSAQATLSTPSFILFVSSSDEELMKQLSLLFIQGNRDPATEDLSRLTEQPILCALTVC